MAEILVAKINGILYYGYNTNQVKTLLYEGKDLDTCENIDYNIGLIINFAKGEVGKNPRDINDFSSLRFSIIESAKVIAGDTGIILKAMKSLDPYNKEIDKRLCNERKYRIPKRIHKNKVSIEDKRATYLGMDRPGSIVYVVHDKTYLISSVQAVLQGSYDEITRITNTVITLYLGQYTALNPIALSCKTLELPSTFYSGDDRTKAMMLLNIIKHLCRSVGLIENVHSLQFLEDNIPDSYGTNEPQEFGDIFVRVTNAKAVYAGAPAYGWLDLGNVKTLTDRRNLTKSVYSIVSFILGMTSPDVQEIPKGKDVRLSSDDLIGDKAQSLKEQQFLRAVRDAI